MAKQKALCRAESFLYSLKLLCFCVLDACDRSIAQNELQVHSLAVVGQRGVGLLIGGAVGGNNSLLGSTNELCLTVPEPFRNCRCLQGSFHTLRLRFHSHR